MTVKFKVGEKSGKPVYRHCTQLRYCFTADFDIFRVIAQTAAVTGLAHGAPSVARLDYTVLHLVPVRIHHFEKSVDAAEAVASVPQKVFLFLSQLHIRTMNRKTD